MKKNNKKGFTLAELLIVVAIIAVLVAVAIPVFTSQLEKSRDAVTISNLRSAYAMAQTAYLTEQSDNANSVTYAKNTTDGDNISAVVTVGKVVSKGQSNTTAWSNAQTELPFASLLSSIADLDNVPGTYSIDFTYDDDGKISAIGITP